MTPFRCVTTLLLFVFFIEDVLPNKPPFNKTFPVIFQKPAGLPVKDKRQTQQGGFITCKPSCSGGDKWDWLDLFYDSIEDCTIICSLAINQNPPPVNVQYVYVSSQLTNNETISPSNMGSRK